MFRNYKLKIFTKFLKNLVVFLLAFLFLFSDFISFLPQDWQNSQLVENFQVPEARAAVTCGFGSDNGAGRCIGFITQTASTTWVVPNDWNNASNTIELIAGGGAGGIGSGTGNSGNGGGGGAYAAIINFSTTTGASVKIQVGGGGQSTSASGTPSFFNWNNTGSTSTCSASTMSVCAMPGLGGLNGTNGQGALGGSSSTSVGTTKYSGGKGGNQNNTSSSGGGGGGAGGKNDNGKYTAVTTSTTGGQGDGTFGGAGGGPGNPGITGATGTEWAATVGSGGGGGGANASGGTGGLGGQYGGGGGGGGRSSGVAGKGRQGVIVITYTPNAVLSVSTYGTQTATLDSGAGGQYIGAAFTLALTSNNNQNSTTTSIKVSETGTVNADTGLTNVKFYYNTTSTKGAGGETQFGSGGASFANSSTTITGTMTLATTTKYLFIVFDITSSTPGGQSIDLQITNPSTDLILQNATTSQSSAVALSGITTTTPNLVSFSNNTEPALTDGGRNSQVITLNGAGFGTTTSSVTLKIGSDLLTVSSTNNTVATATIPSNFPDTNNGGANKLLIIVGGQADNTGSTFYVYPQITSVTVPGGFPANTAREYDAGDSDGVITINGHNFGSASTTNPLTILGYNTSGYSSWAAAAIANAQVPATIPNNSYTGNIVLTRSDNRSYSTAANSFRILPRITSNTPNSGVHGDVIQISGNHFCQGTSCPSAGTSTVTDNVKFDIATATLSDFVDNTSANCSGSGSTRAWTDSQICVKVPTSTIVGVASSSVLSSSYLSNYKYFYSSSSAPNAPTDLSQYFSDNVTQISSGGYSSSTTIYFHATTTASNAINMALQVEVRASSTAFTGTPNVPNGPTCASCTSTSTQTSSSTLTANGIVSGQGYHWQARTINTYTGETSSWVLFGSAGSTDFIVDTIAPTITNATSSSITSNSALITWNTNEPADSQVEYSTSAGITGNCATTCTTLDTATTTSHSASLNGLTSATTYYFVAISKDLAVNSATSSPVKSFATLAPSGFQATGTMVSPTFDTGTANGAGFNFILASGTTPGSSKFRVQFAASNCSNGATNAPTCSSGSWGSTGSDYLGPDCTNGSYYFDSGFGALGGSPAITEIKCQSTYNNKRYFRYKALLCSSSDCSTQTSNTPEIDKITINWSP